jgi:excisionase family DNA binding protein
MLSPGDVARLFGVDPKTVCRWANKGWLPCIRTPGRQRRFRQADVDKFLQASQQQPGDLPAHATRDGGS